MHEVGVVEDAAEDALGEDVLLEHVLDLVLGGGGVERVAAELQEGTEGCAELEVVVFGLVDNVRQSTRQFGYALAELGNGLVELLDVRLGIREVAFEEGLEVGGLGYIVIE